MMLFKIIIIYLSILAKVASFASTIPYEMGLLLSVYEGFEDKTKSLLFGKTDVGDKYLEIFKDKYIGGIVVGQDEKGEDIHFRKRAGYGSIDASSVSRLVKSVEQYNNNKYNKFKIKILGGKPGDYKKLLAEMEMRSSIYKTGRIRDYADKVATLRFEEIKSIYEMDTCVVMKNEKCNKVFTLDTENRRIKCIKDGCKSKLYRGRVRGITTVDLGHLNVLNRFNVVLDVYKVCKRG